MATKAIAISSSLTAGTISGPGAICTGSTITLSDAASGGVWSASNANAIAGSSGTVAGVTAGTTIISYTVTNGCGTAVATHTVTISSAASAGVVSGPSGICVGALAAFTETVSGGAWSSSNAHATITTAGVVTGITPGTDTISYTISGPCGLISASAVITVGSSFSGAGTVSGPSSVCLGAPAALTDGVSGGVWTCSNANATIGSASGIVTGITAGADTISYVVSNSCGTAAATHIVTVVSTVGAGIISGPSSVCSGSLIVLSETAAGGAWGSSNTNATITTGGVVTGITPGTDTITYTVINACGMVSSTKIIIVNSIVGGGTISGPSTVCVAAAITLSDVGSTGLPMTGGTWSCSNAHASVGSASGVVTGITPGTDIISYSTTSVCGTGVTTMTVTISGLPVAGTISGPGSVCAGSLIILSDVVAGGVWSAGNTNASVSSSGVVTGASAGTDPISYTVSNSCGTASAVAVVMVSPIATSGVISGPSSVCIGSGITLTSTSPGGTWSSSNARASVVGPGIIDGVSIGIDTIFYSVSGGCGSAAGSKVISVNPVPVVSPVTGPTSQVVGTLVSLSDPVPSGVWTSSAPSVASVGVYSGVVTGLSVGVTTITYTVTNSLGCPTSVTSLHTVISSPAPPQKASVVCVGATISLGAAGDQGKWGSTDVSIASVDERGVVTGVREGNVEIVYSAAVNSMPISTTYPVTVAAFPGAGTISGPSEVAHGANIDLTDIAQGGVWSSSNASVATVSNGTVSAISEGTADIIYTISNYCGSSAATHAVKVNNSTSVIDLSPAVAELSVYPNPGNGLFNIILQSAKVEQMNVVVTDLKGRVVKEMMAETNKAVSIKLDEGAGIYLLTVSAGNSRYEKKLVIE